MSKQRHLPVHRVMHKSCKELLDIKCTRQRDIEAAIQHLGAELGTIMEEVSFLRQHLESLPEPPTQSDKDPPETGQYPPHDLSK